MSNLAKEVKAEVIPVSGRRELPTNMPVTQADVDAMKNQRELLKQFVSSQLRDGIDYGVVPGTDKKSLFKPGAEKLSRLFQLGIRVVQVSKELDRKDNFAMFIYRSEVYPLQNPDVIVAECEGACNSQEKKYKERTEWVEVPNQENKVRQKVTTPVCDILNTLMKMAQKRAVVGAVILAVGASDFFTQDIDSPEDAAQLGVGQKQQTQATAASIPKATNARSGDQARSNACPQCGGAMMISRYPNKVTGAIDWYCSTCKISKPRET